MVQKQRTVMQFLSATTTCRSSCVTAQRQKRQRTQTNARFFDIDSASRHLSHVTGSRDPREWARQEPDLARKLLDVPQFHELAPPIDPCVELATLESYLQWRGWDRSFSFHRECRDPAIALLSHPLSCPLTLGSHLHNFLKGETTTKETRIACIGARAEVSLPLQFWKEMLLYASASVAQEDRSTWSMTPKSDFSVDFIGPDMPINLPNRTASLDLPFALFRKLEMKYHKALLHHYIYEQYIESTKVQTKQIHSKKESEIIAEGNASFEASSLLSLWDGFVLFNPGIGHPSLYNGWHPTLSYILKTGKPILITAHSKLDSERDWATLRQSMRNLEQHERIRILEKYQYNPFASRLEYEEPCHRSLDTASSNLFVLFIKPSASLIYESA